MCVRPSRGSGLSEGYTLVELTVSLTVLLIVGGLAYASYLHAVRAVKGWEGEGDLVNAAHLTAQRVSADLRGATGLSAEGTRWHVHRVERTVTYSWEGGQLLRNGRPTHRPTVIVDRFDLLVLVGEGGGQARGRAYPAALMNGLERWPDGTRTVDVSIGLRSGRRAIQTHTAVAVEQQTWLPLGPSSPASSGGTEALER